MKYPKHLVRTLLLLWVSVVGLSAQTNVIHPQWLFDGQQIQENWSLLMEGRHILQVGPRNSLDIPSNAKIISLPGYTLMPGMIEGHAHVLLHPYNETSWNDQVLKESIAERSIRAAMHAKQELMAGFTTVRDLGSEGAGYADIGVKAAIEKGIIPGPRLLVAGKAIVATGSYGPKGFAEHVQVPLGAEEADGVDNLIRVVRDQIGHGADFIKVYADYRWGPNGEAMPSFSEAELRLIVETAASSGRVVVAHAVTPEAMKRAVLAGISTIEHGDMGTAETFALMKEKGVALCPTLAAGDAISQYNGWRKGIDPEPERIKTKKEGFKLALESGVSILAGGDVGVFPHGENVRELEMMVEYGMEPMEVLKSVTAINARVFGMGNKLGFLKEGYLADLIAVEGRPDLDISRLRSPGLVVKDGQIYKMPE
mgnify:CR=1 FL=1